MNKTIRSSLRRASSSNLALAQDERGLSTVEYVILLVLIAAACVGLWSKFGTVVQKKITGSSEKIDSEVVIEGK